MSAIGDVGVAAQETLGAVAEAPKDVRWRPIILLTALVYVASLGVAWLAADAPVWVRVALIPLFPVLAAGAAIWRRQVWKFRAKDWKFKLKMWEDALDSVSHEAVNTVNAIRAQLIGFRLANPKVNFPEHLDIIEEETRRIDGVVQRTQDPVAWKASKNKKKQEQPQATPTDVGEDPRSRIAL